MFLRNFGYLATGYTALYHRKYNSSTGKLIVLIIIVVQTKPWGTRYLSWLRHYPTSRNAAGWNPDEVIRFFNLPDPSSRTMVLGLTQRLTEVTIRSLPRGGGVKGRPACKADDLTAICQSIV
jgi:hypothetical protein